MLCFSVAKLPQPCQPSSMTEGDGLMTLQSCTYWLVSNSLILCGILGSLFRGFTCVVQKDTVRREYFLSELLCEEQRQSLALGGHKLSVGSVPLKSECGCGVRQLPTKTAAPVILIRQEDGRWGLTFLAPSVFSLGVILFAEGARTKWSLLYFSFKCELLTEAPSAVFPFYSSQ